MARHASTHECHIQKELVIHVREQHHHGLFSLFIPFISRQHRCTEGFLQGTVPILLNLQIHPFFVPTPPPSSIPLPITHNHPYQGTGTTVHLHSFHPLSPQILLDQHPIVCILSPFPLINPSSILFPHPPLGCVDMSTESIQIDNSVITSLRNKRDELMKEKNDVLVFSLSSPLMA